jgi:3-hydroxypropionate dehydrogenase (NADP+)
MLQDLNRELLDEALIRVKQNCIFLAEQGLVTGQDPNAAVERVTPTTNISEAVASASYVQESVYESYNVKKAVFKNVDVSAPESTIIASSSSGLLITKLQKYTCRPERCIVAHPFNPPHLIPLVELVKGKKTSDETVAKAFHFMETLGKVPIVLKKEVPNYAANRLQEALWREAVDLVDQGVLTVEDVDKALTAGPGLRWALMGAHLTFHLADKGGLEGFIERYGPALRTTWRSMRSWENISKRAAKKVVEGINSTEMVQSKTREEIELWRDIQLARLLKVLRYP